MMRPSWRVGTVIDLFIQYQVVHVRNEPNARKYHLRGKTSRGKWDLVYVDDRPGCFSSRRRAVETMRRIAGPYDHVDERRLETTLEGDWRP